MIRNVELSEISDGRIYETHDLCKVDTCECSGCHMCCEGMEDTVVLDPYDIFQLSQCLNCNPQLLVGKFIELNVKDSLILPHIIFSSDTKKCVFLNEKGLCSIHASRPGICRIFPLGRYYHDNKHSYIIQVHECNHKKVKTKINKWIGYQNINDYELYIDRWHYFLKCIESKVHTEKPSDEDLKQWNLLILKLFYFKQYDAKAGSNHSENLFDIDFYNEFLGRLYYSFDIFNISSQES